MSFEENNDIESADQVQPNATETTAVSASQEHSSVFALVKFAFAVIVAVSIVVYVLIWMKQFSSETTETVESVENESEYTEAKPPALTIEERKVNVEKTIVPEPDSVSMEEELDVAERALNVEKTIVPEPGTENNSENLTWEERLSKSSSVQIAEPE